MMFCEFVVMKIVLWMFGWRFVSDSDVCWGWMWMGWGGIICV